MLLNTPLSCVAATLLLLEHLPPELHDLEQQVFAENGDSEDEAPRIIAALEKSGGNKSRAARLLGMSRRTIYRKMEELGIDDVAESPE